MKKAVNISLAIILSGIFLLSFTGMRVLLHYCKTCNVSQIALFASSSDNCCIAFPDSNESATSCETDQSSNASCCISGKSDNETRCTEDCCNNKSLYLINDYEFASERNSIRLFPVEIKLFALESIEPFVFDELHDGSFDYYHPPPPLLTGKSFILFSHQIKIG